MCGVEPNTTIPRREARVRTHANDRPRSPGKELTRKEQGYKHTGDSLTYIKALPAKRSARRSMAASPARSALASLHPDLGPAAHSSKSVHARIDESCGPRRAPAAFILGAVIHRRLNGTHKPMLRGQHCHRPKKLVSTEARKKDPPQPHEKGKPPTTPALLQAVGAARLEANREARDPPSAARSRHQLRPAGAGQWRLHRGDLVCGRGSSRTE
jgi:hypothetical protein